MIQEQQQTPLGLTQAQKAFQNLQHHVSAQVIGQQRLVDRKSKRLNSSH